MLRYGRVTLTHASYGSAMEDVQSVLRAFRGMAAIRMGQYELCALFGCLVQT